jgi:dihydroorotate dehydrogenase (NAD+) catalytic subunit
MKARCSAGWRCSVTDLSVSLGPVRLEHPIINCSGTMELFELAGVFGAGIVEHPPVGAYVPKTVTLEPRAGNPPPRILETAGGMINAIGLPGPGLDVFVAEELPRLLRLPCPVIVSIGGFSAGDYAALAGGLRLALDRAVNEGWTSKVGLELNISCPNVHSGCASIGADPGETGAVVGAVRAVWPGLLVAKLTPNVADIVDVGRAAEAGGADALAAVNTYKGMVVDRQTLKPFLGNTMGGLSGPAIKPLALRAVYELYQGVGVPIIGMGGVASIQDVLEFMSCGARVVAVGSSLLQDPALTATLARRLGVALAERSLSLQELVGRAHRPE